MCVGTRWKLTLRQRDCECAPQRCGSFYNGAGAARAPIQGAPARPRTGSAAPTTAACPPPARPANHSRTPETLCGPLYLQFIPFLRSEQPSNAACAVYLFGRCARAATRAKGFTLNLTFASIICIILAMHFYITVHCRYIPSVSRRKIMGFRFLFTNCG